jgi:hypothetical protein
MPDAPRAREAVRLTMIVAQALPPPFAFVSHPGADGWPIVAIFITAVLFGNVFSRLFSQR